MFDSAKKNWRNNSFQVNVVNDNEYSSDMHIISVYVWILLNVSDIITGFLNIAHNLPTNT